MARATLPSLTQNKASMTKRILDTVYLIVECYITLNVRIIAPLVVFWAALTLRMRALVLLSKKVCLFLKFLKC